jgi:asparagine synthase (glutamine-hydrolysing)
MLLADHAREDVKVVLTGEGADELLGGYRRYRMTPEHREKAQHVPKPVFRIAREAATVSPPTLQRYLSYFVSLESDATAVTGWTRSHREFDPSKYLSGPAELQEEELVDTAFADAEDETLQRLEAWDLTYGLSDQLLMKVDKATMSASLEARVPYLSHHLVDLLYGVSQDVKMPAGSYKRVLKDAFADVIPDEIASRDKSGFSLPLGSWFRDGHPVIERWLSRKYLSAAPYISTGRARKLLEEHETGRRDHRHSLWKIL